MVDNWSIHVENRILINVTSVSEVNSETSHFKSDPETDFEELFGLRFRPEYFKTLLSAVFDPRNSRKVLIK